MDIKIKLLVFRENGGLRLRREDTGEEIFVTRKTMKDTLHSMLNKEVKLERGLGIIDPRYDWTWDGPDGWIPGDGKDCWIEGPIDAIEHILKTLEIRRTGGNLSADQ